MSTQSDRISVIGLGLRMAFVLSAMRDIGWDFEITGYCDPAPVGLPILQSKGIDIGTQYDDVSSLLAAGPHDLVLIGSPNHLHFEHLIEAIGSGWPIFAEKPIVRTVEESVALARRLGRGTYPSIYVGLVARSAPSIQDVFRRIDEGEIGKIVSFDATDHLPPAHGGYIARNWRRKQEWAGSYLLDKMCHDFDLFQRIIGARSVRVVSFGGRKMFTPHTVERPDLDADAHGGFLNAFAGWNAAADPYSADHDIVDH
jgi:predicted dehydrogenase